MATLHDIAKTAGVSINLVSYVLKKTEPPTNPKHTRIIEIAKSMNYVPNRVASALITGKTNNITLMFSPRLADVMVEPFFLHFLDVLSRKLTDMGKGLIICNTDDEKAKLASILGGSSDAILWYLDPMPENIRRLIIERGYPTLMLLCADDTLDYITIDDYGGEYTLLEELYKLGHRRIAFMGIGDADTPRSRAYDDFVCTRCLDYSRKISLSNDEATSFLSLKRRLMSENCDFTALAVCKDDLAIMTEDVFEDIGISVPGAISIVGYDDIPEAEKARVPLTTVRQDIERFTELALEHITKRISAPDCERLALTIDEVPVIRDSTKSIQI